MALVDALVDAVVVAVAAALAVLVLLINSCAANQGTLKLNRAVWLDHWVGLKQPEREFLIFIVSIAISF